MTGSSIEAAELEMSKETVAPFGKAAGFTLTVPVSAETAICPTVILPAGNAVLARMAASAFAFVDPPTVTLADVEMPESIENVCEVFATGCLSTNVATL